MTGEEGQWVAAPILQGCSESMNKQPGTIQETSQQRSIRPGLIFDVMYEFDDLLARAIMNNGGQGLTTRERAKIIDYLMETLLEAA